MKDIVWDRVLSVEVDEIDDDHRKLIGLYNELNHAMEGRVSSDYLAAVLDELINCTVWHFSHEERLMIRYGYPEMVAHKAVHKELIDSARALQARVLEAGNRVDDADVEFLERWLTEHILTDDMRLGAFLAEVL